VLSSLKGLVEGPGTADRERQQSLALTGQPEAVRADLLGWAEKARRAVPPAADVQAAQPPLSAFHSRLAAQNSA
jgi:hypothetical protein